MLTKLDFQANNEDFMIVLCVHLKQRTSSTHSRSIKTLHLMTFINAFSLGKIPVRAWNVRNKY